MGFSFSEFHSHYRSRIILEWVLRLKVEVGDQYLRRPRKELLQTVSEAFDANHQVLVCGDYGPIKRFIDKITRMRLEAGFPLFHVQRAFELYRMIVLPLLAGQAPFGEFLFWMRKINECLTYTIERFSHHFQTMHEKEILEHNRRLEEEVRTRTRELRESERMAYIGEITASLSHEIRNPLAAVKMNLRILEDNTYIRGNDLRRLEICLKEVMRLERILTELLDFAKPLQIKPREADINRILLSCAESLDMKFREKELEVITDLEPGLPVLEADGEKLEQAFINLLLNAVEASDKGGRILVSTESTLDQGSPRVEISIQDGGRGLSEEAKAGLFKPFFTTKSRGTGLGLSNAKGIVEAHGGRIDVMNVRPRGACFKIRLPGGDGHVQDPGSG